MINSVPFYLFIATFISVGSYWGEMIDERPFRLNLAGKQHLIVLFSILNLLFVSYLFHLLRWVSLFRHIFKECLNVHWKRTYFAFEKYRKSSLSTFLLLFVLLLKPPCWLMGLLKTYHHLAAHQDNQTAFYRSPNQLLWQINFIIRRRQRTLSWGSSLRFMKLATESGKGSKLERDWPI